MSSNVFKGISIGLDKWLGDIYDTFFSFSLSGSKSYHRTIFLNHHSFDLKNLTIIKDGKNLLLEGIKPADKDSGLRCFKENYFIGKNFSLDPSQITYTEENIVIPVKVLK